MCKLHLQCFRNCSGSLGNAHLCTLLCIFPFQTTFLRSSVAHTAVCCVSGLSTQSEWTMGPVSPPDQLGSKARLMTVLDLASEEWSCPYWTASLGDWVGCVRVCVGLRVFVNLNQGLNDDKQMPAVGVPAPSLPPLPPEITAEPPLCHLAGPHLVALWGY